MNILLSFYLMLGFCKGRNRGLLSFIYFISIAGITLGVSILIIGLSAINGFKYELKHKILALVPHIEITSIKSLLVDWQNICDVISFIPGIVSISIYIDFTGLIKYKNKFSFIHVRGIDLQTEVQTLIMLNKIDNNCCFKSFCPDNHQVILGKGIADILGVQLGDWIDIVFPDNNVFNKLSFSTFNHLQILDILHLGSCLDYNLVLIPLQDAHCYLMTHEGVKGLAIKVDDVFKVHQLVEKITSIIHDSNLFINSWTSEYGYIYEDIQIIRAILYLSMLLMIFISSFGIIGILIIGIKEKIYDIAILKSFGANKYLIQTIFILRGLSIGIFGSLIGVILGVLISLNLTKIVNIFEFIIGCRLFSSNVYFIEFLPSITLFKDVMFVVFIELCFCLLISWYPSSYVNRIQLSKILK